MKKIALSLATLIALGTMSATSFASCDMAKPIQTNKKVYITSNKNFKASAHEVLKKYFPNDYKEYYEKLFGTECEKEETDYIPPTIPDEEIKEEEKEEITEDTESSSYQAEVTRLVNIERAKAGLPALKVNYTVQKAAQKRAEETKKSFSHTRPNGTNCFTVLGEFGVKYSAAGENIAKGQRTPAEVVSAWMNSAGHRKNIMSSTFTELGVGCYESNGTIYWSQLFIK